MDKIKKVNEMSLESKIKSLSGVVMLIVTLGNLLIGVLNFGIASKLEPIASDIQLNRTRVEALEDMADKKVDHNEFTMFVDNICNRLDRLENKIDRLVEK
jgi:hypothetical protein